MGRLNYSKPEVTLKLNLIYLLSFSSLYCLNSLDFFFPHCISPSRLFPAALYIKGNDVTKLASMAKLKGGRLAREVSDTCLQYWGGMGFTSDVMVSRFYR